MRPLTMLAGCGPTLQPVETLMKRTIRLLALVLSVVAVAGLGLAMARPDLVPAWARPSASKATEGAGLYCQEHGVPEAFCTLCHEDLKEKLLLCPEHGSIPEEICTLCHPEAEARHDIRMCPKGHGLPEHFCIECGTGPSAAAALPDDGWCALHGKPELLCEDCAALDVAGDDPGRACRKPLPLVRLASARLARRIGIETAEVVEERHVHRLPANAETAYDANAYAEITPRVAGFLAAVEADLGQVVRRGDLLALVDSAEIGAAKTRYVAAIGERKLAEVTYERTRTLLLREAVPAKRELEDLTALNRARADVLEAEQKLRNLGLDDAALLRVEETGGVGSRIEVAAPIDGMVVRRHAVRGEAVEPTTPLFAVADTSRLWLWIDVYEADIAKVAVGQEVAFTLPGVGDESYPGRITWVGAEVDQTTRTLRVRAELENPDGSLRAHQFGLAEIRVGDEHRAVLVPRDSVQKKDGVDLVFLPGADGRYRPQPVLLRPSDRGEFAEVAWGLEPGQRVVTAGAFLLKTEIMKGAIGAGCCAPAGSR